MPFGVASTKSRYSGNVSHDQSMPAAIASAEMSSARSRLRTTRWRASGRAGASVKPQLPITAVVTPWKHELFTHRIPGDLRIHVGVYIDETGRDGMAFGVDRAIRAAAGQFSWVLADLGDHAVGDEDVGPAWLGACSVNQRSA